MSLIRALILDFDGVIIESNDLKTRAFESVFGRFPEHAAAMMAYHHAHMFESRFFKFRHLVTEVLGRDADDPLAGELATAFEEETSRHMVACSMVPGAAEFLHTVNARVPMYLASVNPQEQLDSVLAARRLDHFFHRVYGCPPWTKASAVADIVTSLGSGDGVVFVGDSAGDQRAAALNGIEFIARDSGLPLDAPLPASGRDLHEVLALIHDRLPVAPPGR